MTRKTSSAKAARSARGTLTRPGEIAALRLLDGQRNGALLESGDSLRATRSRSRLFDRLLSAPSASTEPVQPTLGGGRALRKDDDPVREQHLV